MKEKQINSYNKLAEYYDFLMDCDYELWSQFLLGKDFLGKGADLACGTGKMTFLLAQAGSNMIGLDISESMIEVASRNKKTAKNPTFVVGDMVKFRPPSKMDFVTCVCDGVNYLSAKQVAEFFRSVASSLKDGGKFAFDVSSDYKLREVLGDNFFYEDREEVTYFWTNKLQKDRVKMDLTFFEPNPSGTFDRFDEQHVQFAHTKDFLLTRLVGAGFCQVEVFDGYKDKKASRTSQRLVFVCHKGE